MNISNDKFILGDVILRKEFFGGIVSNLNTKTYHQINDDAFNILIKLKNPLKIAEIKKVLESENFDISFDELNAFLNQMLQMQIVSRDLSTKALTFFENEKIVETNCLRAPSTVSIYITQFCPKECKHCVTYSSPYINRNDEIKPDGWFKIIDKLRAFGCTTLVFTGGDCLAKEQIFDILHKADGENFLVSVLTDYDGINSKHIQKLKNLKHLTDLQVSLDGAMAETHDWMRGVGSFQKALRRMQMFKENGLSYTLSSVIHKNNLREIDEIVKIYQEYGATHLYLNPLCPYGRGKNLHDYFLNDNELYLLGQKYLYFVANKMISSGNPFWESNIDKLGDPSFHPFRSSLEAVSTGFFSMSINWKGECYLDSKLSSEKILYLGNALTDEIHDIWFNPKLDRVRNLYAPGAAFIKQIDFINHLNGTA
jgi:MoaA/NifB/PqqE/SkfB family radical SAM enzyme